MPRYDGSAYDPPAPVADVSLRTSGGGGPLISNVRLLIDTGADVTLLPRAAVLRLGVQPDAAAGCELIGFNGSRTTADAVELDMIFLNKAFRGRYLLIDADRGILGRDVLSAVALLLDGPKQEWSPVQRHGLKREPNDTSFQKLEFRLRVLKLRAGVVRVIRKSLGMRTR